MRGYQSPFFGFRFFVSKPSLWWIPLMGMAIAYGLLMFVFVMVAYSLWPGSGESPLEYSGDALKALGLGALVALGVWVVVTPLLFTLCFEKMLKRVHLMKGDVIERISLLKSLQSSLYIFFKTLGWRLFWVVIGAMSLFVWAPVTLVIVQLGMAHSCLIDGCDLGLSFRDSAPRQRLALLSRHRLEILWGGIVAGLVGAFVMPTLLIWLFWIPSIYVGACLWTRQWR